MSPQQRKKIAFILGIMAVSVAYRLSVSDVERLVKLCRDKGVV